jgi:ABC-type nitrate/sulfonate/bicarbonate transport system substrate-binding protein
MPRVLVVLALLVAGCGPSGGDAGGTEQTLRLDSPAVGAQAPVHLAMARGYDEAEGVTLRLRSDGEPYDLLTTGRADAAIVPLRDVRSPLVAVMSLVDGDQAGPPPRKGEPPRPGLVLAVTRDTLADHRPDVVATVRALQRGMTEAATDPESAVTAMLDADDTLDRRKLEAQLERAAPGFRDGTVDVARVRAWARWAGRRVAVENLARPLSRD